MKLSRYLERKGKSLPANVNSEPEYLILTEPGFVGDEVDEDPVSDKDYILEQAKTFDSKLQLDLFAENFDIHLDRRRTLDNMIRELELKLNNPSEINNEENNPDTGEQ
ncbi:MAG: hypothetical protein WCY93_08555 [Anaerolineaceae bacterium]